MGIPPLKFSKNLYLSNRNTSQSLSFKEIKRLFKKKSESKEESSFRVDIGKLLEKPITTDPDFCQLVRDGQKSIGPVAR